LLHDENICAAASRCGTNIDFDEYAESTTNAISAFTKLTPMSVGDFLR